ncbi:ZPR1 zinc finger domain-containing protein [Vulcanisaeta distributa]|uniref:ZPR1-related zinc finger protein n=1 Tax=Vulcanisaeta distributa (strain DSM 14429 / JCM 11212 / NBRC 100878 / IC-017) TaxID=572478 RepID=E1QNR6_VULDI|nr:ZPR1 zinc finger domain-containing protein [Vulcanisaeta distributa]ADN50162.1 ZPR1-related zinc finger protein [Vulcanisaeta distributa DSM 14429]
MDSNDLSLHGRVIYTGIEKCPVCGRESLHVVEILYNDPAFGDLILYSNQCDYCGYRRVDIHYLNSRGPSRIIYEVKDDEDVYRTYIFRSRSARISSPELGFDIDPGPDAEAMITTVEGLLLRMLDVAERMEVLNEDNEESIRRLREFKDKVRRALQGDFRFRIIIEDPNGNSMIKPPPGRDSSVRIEPLNPMA